MYDIPNAKYKKQSTYQIHETEQKSSDDVVEPISLVQ